jgi:hypothetical protein
MQIIGINGFKRSGKGETAIAVADVLGEEAFGFKVVKGVGFADKLKIIAARTLGFSGPDEDMIALMDQAKEKWIFHLTDSQPYNDEAFVFHELTGRQYLQNFGNEAREIFGDTFWIDQVLPKVPYITPTGTPQQVVDITLQAKYPKVDVLCITDLRYENEAERVLSLGGVVWEVIRPNTKSDGHASEQVLPRELVTRQIDNSGNLMSLRFQVEKALGTL